MVKSIFCHELLPSVQFSSVAQSCLTLCNPMDCSTPGLPVHHEFLELAQIHIHPVSDAIQASHPLSSPFPSCLHSFPASGSFPMSQFFASGGQTICHKPFKFPVIFSCGICTPHSFSVDAWLLAVC